MIEKRRNRLSRTPSIHTTRQLQQRVEELSYHTIPIFYKQAYLRPTIHQYKSIFYLCVLFNLKVVSLLGICLPCLFLRFRNALKKSTHEIIQISDNIFSFSFWQQQYKAKYVNILGRSFFKNALFGWSTNRGQPPAIERKFRTVKMRMFDTSIVPKPSHAN